MNFLQLVQRTKRECGISGGGPLSVEGVTGETLRLVDWVRDAYLAIQNSRKQWSWLNKSLSIDLAPGDFLFHPVANWGIAPLAYDTDSFYLQEIGGTDRGGQLSYLAYPQAKHRFRHPPIARPTGFTVRPTREIQFNAALDKPYNLSFDYYATAEILTRDTDVPSLPEQFEMLIVWTAVQYYADFEEVPYLVQRAAIKIAPIMEAMLLVEMPELQEAEPLA